MSSSYVLNPSLEVEQKAKQLQVIILSLLSLLEVFFIF